MFVKNQEVFATAIKNRNNYLSDNMANAIALILSLLNNNISTSEVESQSKDYAENIFKYISENKIRKYISYDLVLAALRNRVTIIQKKFIKSLILMSQKSNTNMPAKISQKKLISI